MANKKNTIAGQFDEYFSPFLDAIRVPQPGESGYVPVRTSMEDLAALEIEKQKANTDKQLPEMDLQTQDKLFSGITNFPAQSLDVSKPQVQTRELASSMNPAVKDYITKKLNLKSPESNVEVSNQPSVKPSIFDKYNEEAYNKAKSDYEDKSSGLGALQFIAGIGDAMAGRNSSETAKNFNNIRANIKDNTVGEFLRTKESAISDFKNKQMMDNFNPDSQQSVAFRKMIEAKFPDVAKSYGKMWNQVSASDKENIFEPLKLKENIEARKDQMRIAVMGRQDAKDSKEYERQQLLATPFGQANTPDDAKQLKEAYESKKNFDNKINQMIELRNKFGGEAWNRDAVARGKQLSKDLLLEYKNMAKLGVLSKTDEDIINAIIPDDPLAFSMMPGQDPVMTKLQKFKEDSDKDFATRVQTRTKAGIRELQQSGGNPVSSSKFPMQVRKGNQTATVSNEQELKEAKSEGWN